MNLVAWQPPVLQTIRFGTADSQNAITSIASDPSGVYTAGFVGYENVTPSYLFVTKYGLDGHEIWTQHFGEPYYSDIGAITVGANGVYVTGYISFSSTNESSFVTRYDLNGNQVWTSRFFENSFGNPISASSSSTSVYVAGSNGGQYFVNSYYDNGSLAWTRSFSSNPDRISVFAASNSVYTAYENATGGGIVQGYDSAWTLKWTQACTCRPMGITSDGTALYVVGTVQRASLVPSDGFLTKYDTNGNQLWTRRFTPPAGNFALPGVNEVRISADSSGVYVSETTGDERGVVLKYENSGGQDWSLTLPWTTGAIGTLTPFDVITAQPASLYVAGDIRAPSSLAGVAFLASISKLSSLVFFGINPPFSFGLLGVLVAAAVVNIVWFIKRWRRKIQYLSPGMNRRLENIPADIF